MGLFEHFPYTNFHELNLDWLLRMMKELSARMDKIDGGNIEDDIANVIQQMIRDGSLAALLEAIALDGQLLDSKNFESNIQQPVHYTVNPSLSSLTAEDVYDLYDALEDYDGFEKQPWGVDEDGKELSYYVWTCDAARKSIYLNTGESAGERTYTRPLSDTLNEFVIFSGVHGNEKANVWALYHMVKAILEEDNPLFSYIRRNFNFIIAPCVNPWGMDQPGGGSRLNKNGVDLNRNFPYMWDSYSSAEKGSSAGSEKGTQMVMDIIGDLNTSAAHNGCVIIDSHDFQGTTGSIYEGRYYVAACTEPEMRISLEKAAMKMLYYYESAYPSEISGADHPVRVTNLTPNVPTLENWTYHLGFRYTMLQECRTNLAGSQYNTVTHNVVWYTLGLALCVAAGYVGHKRQTRINTLSDIGVSTDNTLSEICAAMPARATLSLGVYSGSTLYDDMPAAANGILTIDSGNWDDIPAIKLTYTTFSASAPVTYSAVAFGSPVTVSAWQELATV